ncbi:MAG TPA: glycoside hydrolase family 32 protein [Terracidiphilus sp.]|nr:glycoside hydrolase family 32 protein [Terracidiphilus sp.]
MNRRAFVASINSLIALRALNSGLAIGAAAPDAVASRLAADPRRPQFHLLPPANWMNDPNGPIYWKGKYHMFYQYNPVAAVPGPMYWGHAASADMVHWRHLPVALAPTPGGPDADGCWTGTAAAIDGQVALLYAAVKAAPRGRATIKDGNPPLRETQCLALSENDDLTEWKKLAAPVIDAPPPGLAVNGFRDPSPWKLGDWWYMVIGSGIANQGGAVLLYRSRDLRAWEYLHPLAQRSTGVAPSAGPVDPWEVWECPEFFALDGRYVLIYSTGGKTCWQSGTLDQEQMIFHPEKTGFADYGSFYAAKTQLDADGNRILWGWIQESRPESEYRAAGWAGVMSLPRKLSLSPDGRLLFSFAPQLERLRGERISVDPESILTSMSQVRLKQCSGEVRLTWRKGGEPFRMSIVAKDAPTNPWLTVEFEPGPRGGIFIDNRPLPQFVCDQEEYTLHFYFDGSVIELLVNDSYSLTRRFYFSGDTAPDIGFTYSAGWHAFERLDCWQINPISNDRLTT